jgi:hypothetical protein
MESDKVPNHSDYSLVATDELVVQALKDGFKEAQSMIRSLNMAPSTVARNKKWFTEPWSVEKLDPKHFAYVPTKTPIPGEDGDGEVLRHTLEQSECAANDDADVETSDNAEVEGEADATCLLENEARDAIRSMLDEHERQLEDIPRPQTVIPYVTYSGNVIYKSTLVSQLNGNPFLSKDRLTRVRNSVYFNNSEDYVSAANLSSTCLLGLGCDCVVYFMQRPSTTMTSAARVAGRRGKRKGAKAGPSNIYDGVDEGCWWLGRVQKMRKKVGNRWGICRQPFDLMNREVGRKSPTGPTKQVLLNWFSKTQGNSKFKYDHSDCKWVDVDAIISTVTLTYSPSQKVYTLNLEDAASLNEFVTKQN